MKARFARVVAAAALFAATATHAAVLPADAKTDTSPSPTPTTFTPDHSWTWMANNDVAVRPLRPQGSRNDDERRTVPEPGILGLLVLPALALAAAARRRRSR